MEMCYIVSMDKTKQKLGALNIRIEVSLIERLRTFAARYKLMYSKIVRTAIEDYLNKNENK